jgi:hypothetical protein
MVSADGAVVNDNVPGPKGDGVPLYPGCESTSTPRVQSRVAPILTFLTSNRFFASASEPFFLATGGASVMSTSAMMGRGRLERLGRWVGRSVMVGVASLEAKQRLEFGSRLLGKHTKLEIWSPSKSRRGFKVGKSRWN